MGDVLVIGGRVSEGRIASLDVELHGLPGRTVDRDTVVRWMRDGHSLIPRIGGKRGSALQLIEVGDALVVRHDTQATPADSLPAGLR